MFKINAFSSNFRVPSIRKLGTLRSIRIMRNSRMPRMKSIMNLQRLSTSNIEENDAKIIDISVNWVEKWVRFFEFFSKKKILFANFFNAHFTRSFFKSHLHYIC